MSRPLIKASELRRQFKAYFTAEELAGINAKATGAGLPISAFIREASLGKRIIQVPTVNAGQWAELARLAGNLNQIAAYLNSHDAPISATEWRDIFFAVNEARRAADQVRVAITTAADIE
jgi:hypothetical protein